MDSSNAQTHNQDFGSQTLESMLASSNKPNLVDLPESKKPRPPNSEQSLKCPRCDSANTKFCYYNNYSLTQPRYFCKSCRRYWTKGGTLRNVPVGGGCRRNNNNKIRSTSTSACSNSSTKKDQSPGSFSSTPRINYSYDEFSLFGHPNMTYGGGDTSTFGGLGLFEYQNATNYGFHNNMYYGMGSDQELMNMGTLPFHQEFRNNSVKQEMMMGENKILWGFPWQQSNNNNNGDGNIISTNGGGEYGNWHGIMNSAAALM